MAPTPMSAVAETDAAGAVTHHRYDLLGNEIETSRTAGAAWSDWTSKTVDPTGLVLTETSFVTSGGVVVPARTTTRIYDGSGAEIRAVASDEGTRTTAYDAKGDVWATWQPSASTMATSAAEVQETDADGRTIEASLPATNQVPAVTTYDPNSDEIASFDPSTEAETSYGYDEAGGCRLPAPRRVQVVRLWGAVTGRRSVARTVQLRCCTCHEEGP